MYYKLSIRLTQIEFDKEYLTIIYLWKISKYEKIHVLNLRLYL